MFDISVLLDVKANLPKTSPFFVCLNGFGEHLFSNVGMYNFVSNINQNNKNYLDYLACRVGGQKGKYFVNVVPE